MSTDAAASTQSFDVVVVGGGSAGAVVAARLSEDPSVRVALVEAGGTPPPHEAMPAAVATLQLDPEVDWMFTGDPGGAGEGLADGRMMVPRGKMLGGSSGLNYMAYVRGHPGDFDGWAADGAKGWSYDDVLPYFAKSEGLVDPGAGDGSGDGAGDDPDAPIDAEAHGTDGPLGVSVRTPRTLAAQQFVAAAEAAGIPRGDYNGRDRGGPVGVSSLFQTTTRDGKRSSTFHAFLEPALERENLTILTHAQVEQVLLEETGGGLRATGVRYRDADGVAHTVLAEQEVVVSGGAIGSPQLLLLSGIGPADELAEVGVECRLDNPHVGKHLKDHLHLPLAFPAPGVALTMTEIAISLGPDALRAPAGPLPADPADDDSLPPELAALKAEAERRVTEWATTGKGLASSSFYDAVAFFSTGLGDEHTHDAQIGLLACGYTPDIWRHLFRVDPDVYFADPAALSPDAQTVVVLPNPVQPHSEGQVRLASSDPAAAPVIELNYLDDPHDVRVMVAVVRRALEIVAHWPGDGIGELMVPPALAEAHGHVAGQEPSDELIEAMARHYALTVYHETSTCRMGSVVDAELKVEGVGALRVADASVMPTVVSGNTNAASIMIGEKAAEMIAQDHDWTLAGFVGEGASRG